MSDKIAPALTPAEWADWSRMEQGYEPGCTLIREGFFAEPLRGRKGINLSASTSISGDPDQVEGKHCHALAAIALHGQPFGFTSHDVFLLKLFNGDLEEPMPVMSEETERLRGLVARIAALLPPEE